MVDLPTGYFVAITGGSALFGIFVGIGLLKLFGGGTSSSTDPDEKYKENLIKDARNFDELVNVLKRIGPIRGTKGPYNPKELTNLIYAVRGIRHTWTLGGEPFRIAGDIYNKFENERGKKMEGLSSYELGKIIGNYALGLVTDSYGLRSKVRKLLYKESKHLEDLRKRRQR